ncbi:CS1 type fimbrial major subunit [Photobacterium swingsii]|uniref:CS1 type fimbrial major subunit n=1 Tax=Photobacterium swingsii TaxID=680026 RepID=UPI00354EB79B
MSQLKRNVIAASLAAAGMFAVAAPSVADTSAPQEIKVKATVGSYMDWKRVDGVAWTEAMQLTHVANVTADTPNGNFKDFEVDTIVKPASAGKKVSFTLKDELTLVNGSQKIENFTISVGGVALEKDNAKVVVAANESGVVGVGKTLKVVQGDAKNIPALTKGKYVGYASIVLEGEA